MTSLENEPRAVASGASARSTWRLLFILVVLMALGACSPQARDEMVLGPGETEPPLGPALLTSDQANRVIIRPDADVMRLALSRPLRDQNIGAIRFRLQNYEEGATKYTLMRLGYTRFGLQHYTHVSLKKDPTAINESGLNVFGVGGVLYRADFGKGSPPALGKGPIAVTKETRLVSGRLFSLDSPFTTVEVHLGREINRTSCIPSELISATNVHPSLQGLAVVLRCASAIVGDEQVHTTILYLDRYAQYIPHATLSTDDKVLVRFEVANVLLERRQ